jgi:hypothetical protein
LDTCDNIGYVDSHGRTALFFAMEFYTTNPNCDSSVLLKMLNMDCKPEALLKWNCTLLYVAFTNYSTKSYCDSNVLLKLLELNCKPGQIIAGKYTALTRAFITYGSNPNCNAEVFLKLLNTYCKPGNIEPNGMIALIGAFKSYGANPNCDSKVFHKLLNLYCQSELDQNLFDPIMYYALSHYGHNTYDPKVFLKLILLFFPNIEEFQVMNMLDLGTNDQLLKDKILQEYYHYQKNKRDNIIFKRRTMGKGSSSELF